MRVGTSTNRKERRLATLRLTDNMPGWRNGRRCGLKILHPASYLVIRNEVSSIYRRFSHQSKLTSCLVSLGDPRIFHASLDQRDDKPGNVRQLCHVVEGLALCAGAFGAFCHLLAQAAQHPGASGPMYSPGSLVASRKSESSYHHLDLQSPAPLQDLQAQSEVRSVQAWG